MLNFEMMRAANMERQKEWDEGNVLSLSYLGNAAAGELGEACNVIKKLEREALGLRGSKASVPELEAELADVIIYLDLIAAKMRIDLGEAVRSKFNATSEKYGLSTRL